MLPMLDEVPVNSAAGPKLFVFVNDELDHFAHTIVRILAPRAAALRDVAGGRRGGGDTGLCFLPTRSAGMFCPCTILPCSVEGKNQARELRVWVAEVDNLRAVKDKDIAATDGQSEREEIRMIAPKARNVGDRDHTDIAVLDPLEKLVEALPQTCMKTRYAEVMVDDVD